MGVQTYSAQQRRAVNLIWAAAGKYGFEPKFLAMKTDGTPDFYMNFVIGLVYKWFGRDMLERLFDSWLGDVRQAVMDDLAWLALESAVYQKELPGRPALEELRQDHAREFFAMEYQTSRQEWMARNQLVYSMQAARWKNVLGKPDRLVTPWDKSLYRALCCGDVSGEELEQALRACFRKYLGFDGKVRTKAELRLHFDNRRWIAFMTKMAPTELVRTDDLAIGRAAHAGQAGFVRAADALRSMLRSNERAEADRAYIQRCFGRSMYAPKQLSAIEQQRCTGNHLGCRLWFTRGDPAADVPPSSDSQQLYEQAAEQSRLNRAAYAKNSELYESALLRLTEQIRNCMLVHQQPEAVTARQGWLDGARVWREPVLGDDRVFLRQDQEPKPGFSVDLLLDGSASRLHCQETIAAQGYILAKSLLNCGIPVRVTSFCSLRGYTVLRVLKEYGDKQGERRIFDYFAAGWNRDGLALRGMEELMQSAPAEKHLLLILTDANPDDSHRIPPNGKNPISREYDGKAGVEDTADEVRDLRRRGIRVAAIFMGEQDSVPAADRIYGKDLARIRRMDQLAQAAGRLIQDQIRELAN